MSGNSISKPIRGVVRAVDVIRLLMEEPRGVLELSRSLKLGQSTVHRLLVTLEATGLAMQDTSNRKYCLGPLFWKAAAEQSLMHEPLTTSAREEMEYLQVMTGETIGLYVQVGVRRLLLEGVESKHHIKLSLIHI